MCVCECGVCGISYNNANYLKGSVSVTFIQIHMISLKTLTTHTHEKDEGVTIIIMMS